MTRNFFIMIFIGFAIFLFALLALHDLIHIPPFTNIEDLKKHESNTRRFIDVTINGLCGLIPLSLLIIFNPTFPSWALRTIQIFYGMLLIGAFLSWWIPYIFGSPLAHRKAFEKFKNTHHFLPTRGENIVPNTFHVFMHIIMLICFILSLKL
jgi:hypothetical protein